MKEDKCYHCSVILNEQKRYHVDQVYCTSCYTLFFKLKKCCLCGKRKRIPELQLEAVCKECLYKDIPCVKCGKIRSRITQITKNGPICISCTNKCKYHTPCDWCHGTKYPSSNRNLATNNEKAYICDICYNNTLPICSLCSRRRIPLTYSLTQEPVCKYCTLKKERNCKTCGTSFPAGIGNYCLHCKQVKTFNKRVLISESYFEPQFAELFKQFAYWLGKRRGMQFTSVHLLNYVEYFQVVEKLTLQLGHVPTYKELISYFTVVMTRKYLSVTLFFNEIKFIEVDRDIQEEFSNLDIIDRYLMFFDSGTTYYQYLGNYHKTLLIKLEQKKTSIRSIRLALSPAVNFLKILKQSNLKTPTNEALYAYLWTTVGQMAAITGFINFLNKSYEFSLKTPQTIELSLLKETKSKKQLQQSLIQLLRKTILSDDQKQQLFKLSIGYFHGIALPKYMRLSSRLVNTARSNDGYFKMCYEYFYLPEAIIKRLK